MPKLKQMYDVFVTEWNKKHSISKAPSFSSWRQYYYDIPLQLNPCICGSTVVHTHE